MTSLLQKIVKKLKARRALARQQKYEKEIDAQAKTAGKIYDQIIDRVDPARILAEIDRPVSKEIMGILNSLKQTGYVGRLDPLPNNPKISIVIPHFNQTGCLAQTLQALADQNYLPDEVILVDDQSDSFSEVSEICNKFKGQLNINLIRAGSKLYTGKARQLGAESATGDIIIMNDADDISHHNRIELTKYVFKKFSDALHVNVGIVSFSGNFVNYVKPFSIAEADQRVILPEQISARMRNIFTEQRFTISEERHRARRGWYGAESTFGLHDGNVAFRKEVIDKIHYSGFGNKIFTRWVDYEFNFMLFLAGFKSYQIDLPLIYYRLGASTFNSGQ